jgi:hypothetical protein
VLKQAMRDNPPDAPTELRIVYRGEVLKLGERELAKVRRSVHSSGRPPNESRVDAAEALLEALWRKAESFREAGSGAASDDAATAARREALLTDLGERIDFHRFVVVWWRLLQPAEVLGWLGDRDRLARAAGNLLTAAEVNALAASWANREAGPSIADIALLDELRGLLGTPPKRRRRRAEQSVELRTWSERQSGSAYRRPDHYDEYSHVVVDEAQDLSPMQWRMIGRRGRYASWTIVGDPVQSSWPDPAEAERAQTGALGPRTTRRRFTLRTNYRNSAEIFGLAARVVGSVATGDQLPHAVRSTGVEPSVRHVRADELADSVVAASKELLTEVDGTIGVITSASRAAAIRSIVDSTDPARLRVVDGLEAKGLEYDAVVVVEPAELIAESTTGPRTLYVALTRATQRLTVVTTEPSWP